jgi:RNA polymerase sigma-70 factor (ECF subfamily)
MRDSTRAARFQTLLNAHRKILYKVCHSYCQNRADWDDLGQEILFQLWRAFDSYDEAQRFSTWMYRVALNVAISFYRREKTRTRYVTNSEESLFAALDETTPPSEDVARVYRYVSELDPMNRALMILYVDGHSYQEISEIVGITETNVATKLSRLKKALKTSLAAPKDNR